MMRDIVFYVAFLDVLLSFGAVLWDNPLWLLSYLLINSLIVVALAHMVLTSEEDIHKLKQKAN